MKRTDEELYQAGKREARAIVKRVNEFVGRAEEKRRNQTAETYVVGQYTRFEKQMKAMIDRSVEIDGAADFVMSEYSKEIHGTKKRFNEQKAHARDILSRYTVSMTAGDPLAGF